MADKLMYGLVIMVTLVVMTAAYVPAYNFASQFPRLFQAACLVTNATSGEVLQNEECQCGDETVACDVGPITHYNVQMTFCNKLDTQTVDDLFVMQFACQSGVDPNCGLGTFCDIGPLTYDGVDYYLCRFVSSTAPVDTSNMCKPDVPFNGPPAWGQGFGRYGGRGRWGQGMGPGMGYGRGYGMGGGRGGRMGGRGRGWSA